MTDLLDPEGRAILEASHRYKDLQDRNALLETALIDTIVMFENYRHNKNMPDTTNQYGAMATHLRKLLKK
jgi:hypothetical protein